MSLRSTFSLPEEEEEPVGVSAPAGAPSRGGGTASSPRPTLPTSQPLGGWGLPGYQLWGVRAAPLWGLLVSITAGEQARRAKGVAGGVLSASAPPPRPLDARHPHAALPGSRNHWCLPSSPR